MEPLPPLPAAPAPRDQRVVDADHLRLLAIFHFVLAGLAVLGIGFLVVHYSIMQLVFNSPEMWKDAKGMSAEQFVGLMRIMYGVFAVVFILGGIANLLSGMFMRQRRHRTFSLVVAGLNCLNMPFGTILGVFTFFVLLRESVREVYRA